MKLRHLATALCALAAVAATVAAAAANNNSNAATEVVFTDNFDQLPSGVLMGTVGAEAEYHFISDTAPKAGWGTATFRSDAARQRGWRGVVFDGKPAVAQFFNNTGTKNPETHSTLSCDAAGATLWTDYTVKVRFIPRDTSVLSGIAFRYVTSRNNYRLQVINGRAQIVRFNDETDFRVPDEKILVEKPFAYNANDTIDLTLEVTGDTFTATLKNATAGALQAEAISLKADDAIKNKALMAAAMLKATATLTATDTTFPAGKIALVSDAAATYTDVKVLMTPAAKAAWLAAKKARDDDELALQAKNPKLVPWKKIDLGNFGTGRNIRFGNLLGDGRKQIVLAQINQHGPGDGNAEISCITAIDLDGKRLWQIGLADPWRTRLSSDTAIQCHDINGDGRDEVIYTMNHQLIIADGATGKTIRSCPTPERLGYKGGGINRWSVNILGDAIFFCDVRGTGRKADILIKDRYQAFWLYDENLNPLWHAQCGTGHYPVALDIDGDGRDEILVGYSLYSPDGKLLWTHDDKLKDHNDGVAFVRLRPDDPHYTAFIAASDEGALLIDENGAILKQYRYGHVQNPGVAKFDPDDPGLQVITVNFWGNQGIIHFFDSKGNLVRQMEPFHHGSMCLPVNWTGEPSELVMLSPNHEDGGLYDFKGRRAVRIPNDGHPELCYHALDLTGDCRDEIVVWDNNELWIYTQDDNGKKTTPLYKPVRDYLMNDSNYRAYISIPPDYPAKIERKK